MIRTTLVLLWAIDGQAYTSCTAFKEEWEIACPGARDLPCDSDAASVTTALAEVFMQTGGTDVTERTCGYYKDLYVYDCSPPVYDYDDSVPLLCPARDTIFTGAVSVPAFIWNQSSSGMDSSFVPAVPATVAQLLGADSSFTVDVAEPCMFDCPDVLGKGKGNGWYAPVAPFGDLALRLYQGYEGGEGGALYAHMETPYPSFGHPTTTHESTFPHCYMLDVPETSDQWLYCRTDPNTGTAKDPSDFTGTPQPYLETSTGSYVETFYAKLPLPGQDMELYMGLAIGEDVLRRNTMQMEDFDAITYLYRYYTRMGRNALLLPYALKARPTGLVNGGAN